MYYVDSFESATTILNDVIILLNYSAWEIK